MSEDQTLPDEAGEEVVAEQPEVETQTKGAEAPEGEQDAEGGTVETEGEEEGTGEESAESKSKARRERRKAELARLREAEAEAQRKADEQKREIERLRAEAEKLPQPKLDDYENWEKYQAALTAFHTLKAVDERDRRRMMEQAEAEAKRAEEARQMQQQEAAQYWEAQKDDGRSKYADFDTVALAPDVPITPQMGEIILQSDVAADITYYLGKNRELAQQISEMRPMDIARAIGRLEASLTAPKPKTVSEAPAPIKPVKSKATAIPDVSKMTMAEYRKYRETGKLS